MGMREKHIMAGLLTPANAGGFCNHLRRLRRLKAPATPCYKRRAFLGMISEQNILRGRRALSSFYLETLAALSEGREGIQTQFNFVTPHYCGELFLHYRKPRQIKF